MQTIRIPVFDGDVEHVVVVDDRARKVVVKTLRETGELEAVEVDMDSGERRAVAA